MAEKSPHPNKQAFTQGIIVGISTPNHTPKNEETIYSSLGKSFEVTYDKLWTIRPITR